MRNGKLSLFYDIRYFAGGRSSYLNDHAVTAYGRRLAWCLNSEGISLGAYHSLYVHFTSAVPAGEIVLDPYEGGGETWWFRYAHVGVGRNFPQIGDAHEVAVRGTLSAVRMLLPEAKPIVDRCDQLVREHAGDLRFLVREVAYKRYTLKIAATIPVHPEPSQLYVTVVENATGQHCETPSLPIGFYSNAFDEALSVTLKDFEINRGTNGQFTARWCERIRKGWPAGSTRAPNEPEPYSSKLVKRQ